MASGPGAGVSRAGAGTLTAAMKLCLDVQYEEHASTVACIGFDDWTTSDTVLESVERSSETPAPYEPGRFYKRELPLLLATIRRVLHVATVDVVIVDGHVWLEDDQPGLGAHLFRALDETIPVIGVAKAAFREGSAVAVRRGESAQPLFVTAAGLDVAHAVASIASMHGVFRIPTLLKRVDRLARGLEAPDPARPPGRGTPTP